LNYPLPHASTDLTGQVALVTGASGGLGRRFAMTLASAGAAVVVAARRIDKLARLTEEIEAAGGCCISVALDKTNADQIGDSSGFCGPIRGFCGSGRVGR
jgi:NADP-dependent 3-hydroxy acid dehydrogenase YdfG